MFGYTLAQITGLLVTEGFIILTGILAYIAGRDNRRKREDNP